MNVRRMAAKAAALVVFGGGLTGLTAVTGATPAMACGATADSHSYARHLPQVRPNQRSTYVLGLQLELRDRGYKLQGTGFYGPRTLTAVKDYQRRHHIKASGLVGPKTWDSLIGSRASELTGAAMQWYVPRFQMLPGDRDARHNDRLYEVVSRSATDYHRVYAAYDHDNGVYGKAMQTLVKEFQRKNGIKASGIVGPKTWAAYHRVISITGNWGC